MMEQGENFSDDLQENLRIENEFLKIKLKAQYGDSYHMEMNNDLPPDIENQFLKRMMAFEDEYANAAYTTIYERIGSPAFRIPGELSEPATRAAVRELLALLEKNDIFLEIADGPYPSETIYRFIVEELFGMKVETTPIAGIDCKFLYESFHPNHKADIIKRTHTFFKNWVQRQFTELNTELSWHCITFEGDQLTREDVVEKMTIFFDSFYEFTNDGYNIDNTSFELLEKGMRCMGFAEGMMKYDAVMENGEVIHYEGPYKLYMQMEDDWWSIFYFIVPGFKW